MSSKHDDVDSLHPYVFPLLSHSFGGQKIRCKQTSRGIVAWAAAFSFFWATCTKHRHGKRSRTMQTVRTGFAAVTSWHRHADGCRARKSARSGSHKCTNVQTHTHMMVMHAYIHPHWHTYTDILFQEAFYMLHEMKLPPPSPRFHVSRRWSRSINTQHKHT